MNKKLGLCFISVFFIKVLLSIALGTGFDPTLVTVNAIVLLGVGILMVSKKTANQIGESDPENGGKDISANNEPS